MIVASRLSTIGADNSIRFNVFFNDHSDSRLLQDGCPVTPVEIVWLVAHPDKIDPLSYA